VNEPAWDDETARACGIAWLLAETAPAGAFGRAARARRAPLRPGDEPRARRTIAACAALAERAGAQALGVLRREIAGVPDLAQRVRRAAAGETLDDVDLYEALRFAAALRAIAAAAREREIALDPALELTSFCYPAMLAPGATPAGGFHLADAFAGGLAAARAQVEAARARLDVERSRIDRVVAEAAGRETVRADEFVVMRDALDGPLPAAVRVLREAPTYVLCERVLDAPALAALAALDVAERDVAAREDDVRARLSAVIAGDAEAFESAILALGELDVAVSEAAFAARHATCVPEIADGLALELIEARFLPLATGSARYVPLDFALDAASVLTGPNMGGKTTALRTAGFAAACVALGLPVPARRARVGLFARYVWLAPEEAAGDGGLSSFGAEIVRVRALLERPPERALVLIDEFARTTTPREGRALLVALIERLRDRGALVFAATHASGVAAASGATPLAVAGLRDATFAPSDPSLSLSDVLAAIVERMDFRIVRVERSAASASDAIALARALGLDADVADRAERLAAGDPG